MFYQIAALAIFLAFYGCYFAKVIRQRIQGIQTNQLGKGKTGMVRRIEILLRFVAILTPIAELISILTNTAPLPVPARIAGIIIGFAGVAAFTASVFTMGDSWRAGVSPSERTKLVTAGIYRVSRNPAFLGFDLMYIGILTMFFNVPLLILSALAVLLLHLQIVNVEEDFLLETFGGEYLNYKKKVCRYLGRR